MLLFIASLLFIFFILILVFIYCAYRYHVKAKSILHHAEQRSIRLKHEIETERKDALIRLKDELYRKKKDFDLDLKRERLDLDRFQNKLNDRSILIDQRALQLEELKKELQNKEKLLIRNEDALRTAEQRIKSIHNELVAQLEMVGGLTREDARNTLIGHLESEAQLVTQKWIQKVEEEARHVAKEKANNILLTAMHRYAAEIVSSGTSGVIQLPNEEMKGRVIGKEGRNIKALEMATGMEFIINSDTSDITISGFNPIRREIARRTLEKLVADGRINPTRIEEMVLQNEREIEEVIQEIGKNIILEFNLQGVNQEMITLLGKLHFRTSYSQNVLVHCKEVAFFARMIAHELGMDGEIALRAGLFHDIGKAVTAEVEGPHAQIGADIAKRCGESPIIVNAIAAHHEEVPFNSLYAIIIVIADTLSAARPGARRETLTAYIKRLEKLEEIAYSFNGIKKAYALQAGREIRVIVQEENLSDEEATVLARTIAKRIEEEMSFPGQIKVNVIREVRSIEYAR